MVLPCELPLLKNEKRMWVAPIITKNHYSMVDSARAILQPTKIAARHCVSADRGKSVLAQVNIQNIQRFEGELQLHEIVGVVKIHA